MFAIACSLLALAISVIAIWRSGNRKGVITQEKVQGVVSRACANPRIEKAGRNPPPPVDFKKPEPTPAPPAMRYNTKNPIPRDDPWDSNHPCHDIHLGETEYRERFQPPPKKP